MSSVIATIGLGSNVGDRAGYLAFGVKALRDHPALEELDVSGPYETEHVGPGNQREHWNACARYRTGLEPHALLDELKKIERAAGRAPDSHGLPRTLDLDLLLFGDLHFSSDRLQLPHPRMTERRFVLEPLAELVPELEIEGRTVRDHLAKPRVRAQGMRRIEGVTLRASEARA